MRVARSRWGGANGRYTPSCDNGLCAITGNQATSKLEGQIFTLLDYVLGPGQQGVECLLDNRPARLDMTFPLLDGDALVVEYDGAHWHEGHENRDWRKTRLIEQGWGRYRSCYVMRIREAPLPRLEEQDLVVSPRPDGVTCARLALFHLLHRGLLDYMGRAKDAIEFLSSCPRPLGRDQFYCGGCWSAARSVMDSTLLVRTPRRKHTRGKAIGPQRSAAEQRRLVAPRRTT